MYVNIYLGVSVSLICMVGLQLVKFFTSSRIGFAVCIKALWVVSTLLKSKCSMTKKPGGSLGLGADMPRSIS